MGAKCRVHEVTTKAASSDLVGEYLLHIFLVSSSGVEYKQDKDINDTVIPR